MTAPTTTSLADFLLAQLAADEAAALASEEMFPSPWDIADRGWRVRIYAADAPIEDLSSDDPDAMMTRNPVVIQVEPDRNIEDPRWLSERVEHVRRHDPARVLADTKAKRAIVVMHGRSDSVAGECRTCAEDFDEFAGRIVGAAYPCLTLRALAQTYAGAEGWQEAWNE